MRIVHISGNELIPRNMKTYPENKRTLKKLHY